MPNPYRLKASIFSLHSSCGTIVLVQLRGVYSSMWSGKLNLDIPATTERGQYMLRWKPDQFSVSVKSTNFFLYSACFSLAVMTTLCHLLEYWHPQNATLRFIEKDQEQTPASSLPLYRKSSTLHLNRKVASAVRGVTSAKYFPSSKAFQPSSSTIPSFPEAKLSI